MNIKTTLLKLNFLFAICISTLIISAQQLNFERTYGLPGYNYGKRALQTNDDGYLILGNKSGFTGNSDIYLIKTDTLGKLIWDKAIGNSKIEWAEDIIKTFDNGYLIAGYSNYGINNDYQVLLIKIDSLFNVEWLKNYGGTNWEFGYSVVQAADSGFIVTGETYSYGNGDNDVFVLKTDKNGNKLWHKAYGGQTEDVGKSITTNGSNYLIAGYTNSFGNGQFDAYVLKINNQGDTIWTKTFGDSLDDKAYAIKQITDSTTIFCGFTENYGALKKDGLIVKIDSLGSEVWVKHHGGSEDEKYYDCFITPQKHLLFAGHTESFGYDKKDVYVVELDEGEWFKLSNTFGRKYDETANSIIMTSDSGFVLLGSTESIGVGESNIYLVKTDSILKIDNTIYSHELKVNEIIKEKNTGINIYPNPSDGEFIIKSKNDYFKNTSIELFDVNGKKVFSKSTICLSQNINHKIDVSFLNNGFYIVKISNKGILTYGKIIIRK